MLRHYDAIGLLEPATVDPGSGYRFYRADQLLRLNRIIALKDLGFTLEQVRAILDDGVNVEQLRGMLRLRRAQLEADPREGLPGVRTGSAGEVGPRVAGRHRASPGYVTRSASGARARGRYGAAAARCAAFWMASAIAGASSAP
jgi:DNA-binding transcriptional MerR regulator